MVRAVQLVVSLNEAKMLEAARGVRRYDIEKLIEKVPSVTVISGDPAFALRIELAPRHVKKLKSSVSEYCIVDGYREFEVQG